MLSSLCHHNEGLLASSCSKKYKVGQKPLGSGECIQSVINPQGWEMIPDDIIHLPVVHTEIKVSFRLLDNYDRWWPRTVWLNYSSFLHVSQHLTHLSLLGKRESVRGMFIIKMGVAGVDVIINYVSLPTVITLCCKDVPELGDKFLQLLGFSGVQV